MKFTERKGLRTWIEVDRKAVKKNYGVFRSLISTKTKLMAVVKSNAYGHSLLDFSREMEKLGANFLGVDSVVEGLALRKIGIKTPILVLGYTLPEMIKPAVEADISLTVSSFDGLQNTLRFGLKEGVTAKIHIKVDTGMHRQGFLADDLPKILGELKVANGKFQVEGLYTHFAAAKNPAFPQDTKKQIAVFQKWIGAFRKAGLKPIVHAAATAGTLLFPESHFDMVRVGIGLYGMYPSKETESFVKDRVKLSHALEWKTIVSEVKKIKNGTRVGYDFTENISKDTTIAICPIGYWHGYPRALSGIGRVIVGGREVKVLGRVSMDMLTFDVGSAPQVKVGDEVILIGRSGKAQVFPEDIDRLADLSWYETVTRLNPLIKRIYL